MKNYKLIINFNTKDEKTLYFQNITKNILMKIRESENYILLNYNKFTGCYIVFDYKLNENDKAVFNSYPRKYCY